MSELKPRYHKIKGQLGIRKDLRSGKYLVNKKINGRKYAKQFSTIQEAQKWRQWFHPVQNTEGNQLPPTSRNTEANGTDKGYTFFSAYNKYKEVYLSTLEPSTQEIQEPTFRFCKPLYNFKMVELTPELFDNFFIKAKALEIDLNKIRKTNKRFSFDKEIRRIKAFLNWYRENYDFKFVMPLLKRHNDIGQIMQKKDKEKKIPLELMIDFFNALPEVDGDPKFWVDFAKIHFFAAGRVGEVAGIQIENIDLKEGVLRLKHCVVWRRATKRFWYLKEYTKNKSSKYCHLTDDLREILARRLMNRNQNSSHLFSDNGEPLSYRQIDGAYNRALMRCGLYPKYSGTHILRHSMANATRRVMGTADAVQAVTGHKDAKMVNIYSDMPEELQIKSVEAVENKIKKLMENKGEGCAKVSNLF